MVGSAAINSQNQGLRLLRLLLYNCILEESAPIHSIASDDLAI